MENVKEIIAKNLLELRKQRRYTQQDLATKLNYSDKAISRWEHAETLPDIETLCKICDLYGVKFEYLLQKEQPAASKNPYVIKHKSGNRIIMGLLAVTVVWLLACILFSYSETFGGKNLWTLFIWALPTSGIIVLVLNRMWRGPKLFAILSSSFVLWTLLLSLYLQFLSYNIWMLFIVGAPIQALIILASFLKL